MVLNLRQNVRAKCFKNKFGPSILPWKGFHIVMRTAAYDIIEICCQNTDTTLSMAKEASIEYYGGRRDCTDKTKISYSP